MKRRITGPLWPWASVGAPLLLAASLNAVPQAPPAANVDFDRYVAAVEKNLAQEHRPDQNFIPAQNRQGLRQGNLVIENRIPEKEADPPDALLHHWRGTAFAPGATAAQFERLMRDFPAYPSLYAPQVLRTAITSHQGDRYTVTMRVKQKHVITVVMDTAYDVTFGPLNPAHGWSVSRSTSVKEITDAGTPHEWALAPAEAHGFLWRMNTYWTWEQRDGGLYLQIESVSLTRAIPTGLGWAVRPFVDSVPRESLEFTLRKTCDALKNETKPQGERQ